jgi:flagellar motor switch protein FliN/FliY
VSATNQPSQAATLDDIPLNVIVEVGRLQMSIKKLLELQPGNMLELDIHPEAGVDLVVNGKRIARGELLRVGEVLGIRIVELS